jgi:hypothetical protein
MARKSFAQRRLDNIRKNKARLKKALGKLPQAPPTLGFPGRAYNLALQGRNQFVDASSIAFQQELLLNRVVELENNLMNAGVPIPPPSIPGALIQTGTESLAAGEELLQVLSDDDFADTPMIDALLEDVEQVKAAVPKIRTFRDDLRDSRQFSRANLVGGIDLSKPKRTRKKTKTDKNMSKALRLANERYRKKNGSMRKGATQAKIMKYAHRLLKKM